MHVLIVLCHPNSESLTHALTARFAEGASQAGHSIDILDLYAEGFDPLMSRRDLQQFDKVPMPADIQAHQARVEAADALCLAFPVWWYAMPAMMKGWLDRVWSAGWAYTWEHDPEGSLLPPKPCTVLAPLGASRDQLERWGYRPELEHLWRYGVFGYCGFDPIRISLLEDAAAFDTGQYEAHLQTAYDAGLVIAGDPQAKPGIRALLDADA